MSRWYFSIALIIPVGLIAQPGPSNHPIESWDAARFSQYCESYIDDPSGAEGSLCRGFILGFAAGAVAVQEAVAPASNRDEFSDRAVETRAGSRLQRMNLDALPWFCLNPDTSLADIASLVLADLDSESAANALGVAAAVRRALARALPCDTD